MKKNIKKVSILILLFSVFVVGIFSYLNLSSRISRDKIKADISPILENNIADNKIKTQKISEIKPVHSQKVEDVNLNKIKVSLDVLGNTYITEVKDGSSIFDAMNKMKEDNLFNFKYTEHLGLGAFVSEINGVKGTPGKYWIYYVNDIKASIGISNYILKAGDIIKWKQESF